MINNYLFNRDLLIIRNCRESLKKVRQVFFKDQILLGRERNYLQVVSDYDITQRLWIYKNYSFHHSLYIKPIHYKEIEIFQYVGKLEDLLK